MKSKNQFIILLLSVVAVLVFSYKLPAQTTTSSATSKTSQSPTELVVQFYKVLMQSTPPTIEQEQALFNVKISGLRTGLLDRYKQNGDQPILLEIFQKHKELFLPDNMKPSAVQISSPFSFVRNLAREKEKNASSDVIVLFIDTAGPNKGKFRTIIFHFEDGKIDPDGILLNGYDGKGVLDFFLGDAQNSTVENPK